MEVIIDRKIWLRNESGYESMLLRTKDGKKDCVGIYLTALGIPDELLADKIKAEQINDARIPEWLVRRTGGEIDGLRLYCANDACGLTQPERERNVATIFARHGVEIRFVN